MFIQCHYHQHFGLATQIMIYQNLFRQLYRRSLDTGHEQCQQFFQGSIYLNKRCFLFHLRYSLEGKALELMLSTQV